MRCPALTTVTISEDSSLTSIGEYAFGYCEKLPSIYIPAGVKTIDGNAFLYCSSLTSVTFGENSQLTTIGEWAFAHCRALPSITIPESVTSIGE